METGHFVSTYSEIQLDPKINRNKKNFEDRGIIILWNKIKYKKTLNKIETASILFSVWYLKKLQSFSKTVRSWVHHWSSDLG